MDVEALVGRLIEVEEAFQEWRAPVEAARVQGQVKVAAGVLTEEEAAHLVQQVREFQAEDDRVLRDAFEFFDRLCPAYIGASPADRRRLRRAVAALPEVSAGLIQYVHRAANRVQTPADLPSMHAGLAAAALEGGRTAPSDLRLALAELYVGAEGAGIAPIPEFRAVSRLASSTRLRGRRTAMSATLANFHRSQAVRRLRAAARPGAGPQGVGETDGGQNPAAPPRVSETR